MAQVNHKKKTGSKRKKKKTRRIESATFVVEILDWNVDYSFSLDKEQRIKGGPYWEYTSLKIMGRLVSPEKLLDRTIDITILGDREKDWAVEKPSECNWKPISVGGLTINKSYSEYLGSIPFHAIQLLVTLLQAEKTKYIELTGDALYRGSASIRSMHFEKEYEPEP